MSSRKTRSLRTSLIQNSLRKENASNCMHPVQGNSVILEPQEEIKRSRLRKIRKKATERTVQYIFFFFFEAGVVFFFFCLAANSFSLR